MSTYEQAFVNTMSFIGTTAAKSSIMKILPLRAAHPGLGDVRIKGIELARSGFAKRPFMQSGTVVVQ